MTGELLEALTASAAESEAHPAARELPEGVHCPAGHEGAIQSTERGEESRRGSSPEGGDEGGSPPSSASRKIGGSRLPSEEGRPEAAAGVAGQEGRRRAVEDAGPCEGESVRAHFEALVEACAALGESLPGFSPAEALRDPDFLRMTAPGTGIDPGRAWLALHPELLLERGAVEGGRLLAEAIRSNRARPREGGGQSPALLAADYRALGREERQRLKERINRAAARGEKIYP